MGVLPEASRSAPGCVAARSCVHLSLKEGPAMPNEGDTMNRYCETCALETIWEYLMYLWGKEIWECQACKTRYSKSPQ